MEHLQKDMHVPDIVIVDPVSGYTVNMPLGPQDYPGWQEDKPDVIERIMRLRAEEGIGNIDDQFVPKMVLTPAPKNPGGRPQGRLPKKKTKN